jgi:type I restriction enzyme S subunit
MNRELLLKHFDRISDAPDAIPRLRQFILDLAVRGKLVEQDPSDEVPSQLLERLGDGTRQTYEDLPSSWVQAKVGRLLDFQYGKGLPNNARLESGRVRVFSSNGVVGYCEKALSENPAIIIGRKGSAGALNICEGPSWTTDVAYFVVPPPFLTIQFLFIALQTLNLDGLGKGVKPGLSRNDAYQLTLNVPPLSEQNRIVAKVSELMVLCDRWETAQTERESRRDRLASSSLHHLNSGASAEELRQHSRFYLEHLSRLTIFPAQIKQLRHTILNLAIRGRLVSSFCPPGHIASRTQEGRLFASFDVKAFSGDFTSLTLPSHWSVESLAKIASGIVDCPHSTPKWTTEGRICVRTNQFRPGHLDLSDVRYVSESTYAERVQRLTPQENVRLPPGLTQTVKTQFADR